MCSVKKIENQSDILANAKRYPASIGQKLRTDGPNWRYINLDARSVTVECVHDDGRSSLHTVRPGEILTDEDGDVTLEIKGIEVPA